MRYIIYVDGAVGVGKSTFISILEQVFRFTLTTHYGANAHRSHHFNVEVLREPLHRDWTSRIVESLEYENLLKFLLVRKITAIEKWSLNIASDGMQELEPNMLIVERSPEGDRLVNSGYQLKFDNLNLRYTGESVHNIFIKSPNNTSEEQERLNSLYNSIEVNRGKLAVRSVHRIQRPMYISAYYALAANIVQKIIGH